MVTIYDKNGNPKELDSVDAREHIATGRWFADKHEPTQLEVDPVEGKASDHAVEQQRHGRKSAK